jgi:hypothetical protein
MLAKRAVPVSTKNCCKRDRVRKAVGVVGDVKLDALTQRDSHATHYFPLSQISAPLIRAWQSFQVSLVVRTSSQPATLYDEHVSRQGQSAHEIFEPPPRVYESAAMAHRRWPSNFFSAGRNHRQSSLRAAHARPTRGVPDLGMAAAAATHRIHNCTFWEPEIGDGGKSAGLRIAVIAPIPRAKIFNGMAANCLSLMALSWRHGVITTLWPETAQLLTPAGTRFQQCEIPRDADDFIGALRVVGLNKGG